MKNSKSRKQMGFQRTALHKAKEPHVAHFLSQRTSFWVASLSMFAFVVGNMMGQHGWHAFWASVLGNSDDSLIVYTGTVSPIAQVPDYERWAQYGGVPEKHTFRQVPKDFLIDLPEYDLGIHSDGHDHTDVYSVGYMGSYETGAEGSGSHPGTDIRVPEGTPVLAMANGIVSEVKEGGGFGKVIVVRHPNIPDPARPTRTTVLYSSYAHLSSMFVTEGMVVQKGEQIGLSGSTGFVSGPHLHFQLDTDDAPWHPYWPFSNSEASAAGYTLSQAVDAGLNQSQGYLYTINPMEYVQASYAPVAAVAAKQEVQKPEPKRTLVSRVLSRRDERLRERETRSARVASAQPKRSVVVTPITTPSVVAQQVVATHSETETLTVTPEEVRGVDFRHDGSFQGREWEQLRIRLVDAQGATVTNPIFTGKVVPRTAYGDAEFSPAALSAEDFDHGEAVIRVLPRGERTLVFQIMPFATLSTPMRYEQ